MLQLNENIADELDLSLKLDDRDLPAKNFFNMGEDEIEAAFAADSCPDFSPGQKVTLKIRPMNRDQQKEHRLIHAVVSDMALGPDGKRVKFSIDNKADAAAIASEHNYQTRNRRKHYRAKPAEQEIITVTLKLPDDEIDGQMIDISIGGMGVSILAPIAENLLLPECLRLHVNLPQSLQPLDLVGSVPYTRPIQGRYHCGIQFNWEKTAYYYRQEAAISSFVRRCQLNRLQGAKQQYIPIEKAHQSFYCETPLYFKTSGEKYRLYKAAGQLVHEAKPSGTVISRLYVDPQDRCLATREVLNGLNGQLSKMVASAKMGEVKKRLEELLQVAAMDPRQGSLDALRDTVDILIKACATRPDALSALATAPFSRYAPVIHSLNILALILQFCFFHKFSHKITLRMGLAALVHDLSKIEMPYELLYPKRRLTDQQFETYRVHPFDGYNMVHVSSSLGKTVALATLQHHEKLDGSGYPRGVRDISMAGRLLGIIDAFENLTRFHRAYRHAQSPIEALALLKSEAEAGKYDSDLFKRFCYSLT